MRSSYSGEIRGISGEVWGTSGEPLGCSYIHILVTQPLAPSIGVGGLSHEGVGVKTWSISLKAQGGKLVGRWGAQMVRELDVCVASLAPRIFIRPRIRAENVP